MYLNQIKERVWVSSFEEERDRPALGYIYGDTYRLAVDAGHSKEHTEEFYALLGEKGLPLPDFTVLTHWHWDHTFGMCAAHGLCFAERRTQKHLQEIIRDWKPDSQDRFMDMDEHIALEYSAQNMCVKGADIVFHEELSMDLGNIQVNCFHVESSHTDDSVLVFLPEEKILFLGDCISGEYPEWIVDKERMGRLICDLEKVDFEIAIGAHWTSFTREKLLAMLREESQ